ncbi:hypothetical protein GCM10020000_52730 [Streptomyces olivoverticillatus]
MTLHAPLVLGEQGALVLRVQVGDEDRNGRRQVTVHSRPEGVGLPWVQNAEGVLAADASEAGFELSAWPPAGAETVDTDGLYEQLAASGLEYGPLFQGLRAAWRDGDAVYAEIALPDGTDTDGYALHPALLDAALHSIALLDTAADGGSTAELPFSWSDATLYATGATALRVRVAPAESGYSLQLADGQGAAVATVGTLVLRPVASGDLATTSAALHDSLFHVEWVAVESVSAGDGAVDGVVFAVPEGPGALAATLAYVQEWLADGSDGRLVAVTRGAVAVRAERWCGRAGAGRGTGSAALGAGGEPRPDRPPRHRCG